MFTVVYVGGGCGMWLQLAVGLWFSGLRLLFGGYDAFGWWLLIVLVCFSGLC